MTDGFFHNQLLVPFTHLGFLNLNILNLNIQHTFFLFIIFIVLFFTWTQILPHFVNKVWWLFLQRYVVCCSSNPLVHHESVHSVAWLLNRSPGFLLDSCSTISSFGIFFVASTYKCSTASCFRTASSCSTRSLLCETSSQTSVVAIHVANATQKSLSFYFV